MVGGKTWKLRVYRTLYQIKPWKRKLSISYIKSACIGLTAIRSSVVIVSVGKIALDQETLRFLHRKDSEAALKRKRELSKCKDIGYDHLFISENLCPAFRSVLKDLTDLKRAGHIEAVWVTNGTIKYKIEDKASVKPEKIYHKSDISLLKSYIGLSP